MTYGTALADFQDAFARALFTPDAADPRPRLFVYRNTVRKGCIDALRANYPAVTRLVGEEWFNAAAAVYVQANPPRLPMLSEYGYSFAVFLEMFAPATELPYLPSVARLDRFWTEAHTARDEAPLAAQALAGLDPVRLGSLRVRPHAAARWAHFTLPAFSIWRRNRTEPPDRADAAELAWRSEGALIARPHDAVHWFALDAAGCAFLDACAAGQTLAQAAEAALAVDPAVEITALLATLLQSGALAHGSD